MPIPAEHQERAQAIARGLEDLAKLVKDANFTEALNDIYDQPESKKEALRDIKAFLTKHSVAIPKDLMVKARAGQAYTFCTEICVHTWFGDFCIIHWDDTGWGFGGCK
jgi:hypothetical protein